MRINKMMNYGKCFGFLSTSLNHFFKELYGDKCGEFVCGCIYQHGGTF